VHDAETRFDELQAELFAGDGFEAVDLERRMGAWMRSHDVVFADEVIPFVLAPHCLTVEMTERVRHVVEVLTGVLTRFCDAYRTDEALQLALALPPLN
jgi:hypothetical protein